MHYNGGNFNTTSLYNQKVDVHHANRSKAEELGARRHYIRFRPFAHHKSSELAQVPWFPAAYLKNAGPNQNTNESRQHRRKACFRLAADSNQNNNKQKIKVKYLLNVFSIFKLFSMCFKFWI